MKKQIGMYICSTKEQDLFAQLSGDYNPLHLNTLKSRRYLFGKTVMHGIHILLRALDFFIKTENTKCKLTFINASFLGPVYVNDKIEFILINNTSDLTINVYKEKELITIINFSVQPLQPSKFPIKKNTHNTSAKSLNELQIEKSNGSLQLSLDESLYNKMFPALYVGMHIGQVSSLLCSTRLVGMECPGLNSIYSELNLFSNDRESLNLNYNVDKFKKRYSLVKLNINANSLEGKINAFYRPLPKKQKTFKEVKEIFSPLSFKFKSALVIGGSRGLGEACAKLLAANNIEVIITYNKGVDEANKLVEEININNGKAKCISLDIINDQINLKPINRSVDALFYFASPPIFIAKKGQFKISLFDHFNSYYVNGFLSVFDKLEHNKLNSVFYPSSVAIDEAPLFMGEYVSSKLAGEGLCQFLNKQHKKINFLYPRLPRLSSDQTVSLLPVKDSDPVEYFWDIFNQYIKDDKL